MLTRNLWLKIPFLLISVTFALPRFVDQGNPSASDANPGTALLPFKTFTRGVTGLIAGDTLWIKAGVYRESVSFSANGNSSKPVLIAAYPGHEGKVVVKGSDIYTQWTSDGNERWHAAWPYTLDAAFPAGWPKGMHDSAYERRCEMVFADDKPLKQVMLRSQIARGTFYVDDTQDQIVVQLADGSTPSTHVMEIAVRQVGLSVQGAWLVFRGLAVKHVATKFQTAAFYVNGNDNRFENNLMIYNNTEGLRIGGSRLTLFRCIGSWNGSIGFCGNPFLSHVESCTTNYNAWRYGPGWADGGIKFVGGGPSNNYIFRHVSRGNDGPGIWFDYDTRDNRIESCLIDSNLFAGIDIEASWEGNQIVNNVVCRTRKWQGYSYEHGTGCGIMLTSVRGAKVYHNTLINNENYGILLSGGVRPNGSYTAHTQIFNNILSGNGLGGLFFWMFSPVNVAETLATNTLDYNVWYHPAGFTTKYPGPGPSGYIALNTLSAWQALFGQDSHSISVNPGLVDAAKCDARLVAGSPAINKGIAIDTVKTDYIGTLRPQGSACDIGAYEYIGMVETSSDLKPVIKENRLTVVPNPFYSAVRLSFDNPGKNVSITIFALSGQVVASFKNVIGEELEWNAALIGSGVYIIRLSENGFIHKSKAILVR